MSERGSMGSLTTTGKVLIACVLVVGVLAALWLRTEPTPADRRISLEWQCTNHIAWIAPDGRRWSNERGPLFPSAEARSLDRGGPIETGGPRSRVASGLLHFVAADRAIFVSDAGGALELRRQRKGFLQNADCAIP